MSDDSADDPWDLMRSCLERGPRLAVCTRGADGAIALESSGARHEVSALPPMLLTPMVPATPL